MVYNVPVDIQQQFKPNTNTIMSITTPVQYDIYIEATDCNPNGDPLNGGAPRMTDDGYGIISPVCIKRKLRNAVKEIVNVKSDKYNPDKFGIFMDCYADTTRLAIMEQCAADVAGVSLDEVKSKGKNKSTLTPAQAWEGTVAKHWDSRVFGNLINMADSNAIQRGGAVTVGVAKSIEPIADKLMEMQITASVAHKTKEVKNSDGEEDNSSLTGKMGVIHLVSKAYYKVSVASSVAAIKRNRVSELDMELLEDAIKHIFIADASLNRPVGSLRVAKVIKVEYPSSLSVVDGNITSAKTVDGELVVSVNDAKVAKRKLIVTELDCECDN